DLAEVPRPGNHGVCVRNARGLLGTEPDARRNKLMPSGADWDHGTETNAKDARRLTTRPYAGQVEHKYDYSALQFHIPAFGWCSDKAHVGLYFINPSME